MDYVNVNASRKAYDYIQESSASSFTSEELHKTFEKAIAAPALANAALLAANGSTSTFITVVSALYVSNDLPLPDFSELQNITLSQTGHEKSSYSEDQSKTQDSGTSSHETVDFTGINEELKVFNSNFYTITDTSPPDWEDWFDEDHHSNISIRPLKTGSLSSGISVTSLASTTSSDVFPINSLGQSYGNVSMINPPSNSRHSSSSGISVSSFASSSESLDIPNVSISSKLPFSSTPLPSDLRAALSPRKLALAQSRLIHGRKRSSLSPKKTMPPFNDLNNLHRNILSSNMIESSNIQFSNWNRLSLSPRKHLTPFTTPSDLPRYLQSSKVPVSLSPLTLNMMESNSVSQESFKTSNSRTFDSAHLVLPPTNYTTYASPSSIKSGTFDMTADTNTSPWVVVRSHVADPDPSSNPIPNTTLDSTKDSFETAARKMWQRCRTQLF